MHPANRVWLKHLRGRYREYFNEAKVLEIGSYNVNGTARDFFSDCEYVGVDRDAGPGVDLVCQAIDTKFEPLYFDALVAMSVFEHDSDWASAFEHVLQWVRKHGLVVLCWGAEGNRQHGKNWAPVPSGAFLEKVKDGWPLRILDHFFENDRYPDSSVAGVFNVLAIKK